MKLIEFVGLPGAGKTTIAAEVAAALRLRGSNVLEATASLSRLRRQQRAWIKLRRAAAVLRASPAALARLANSTLSTRQRNPSASALNLLNLVLQRNIADLAVSHRGVVVCDQGVFQALWSLNLEAKSPTFDPDLYGWIAGPVTKRLVVFLDADLAAVERRLWRRGDRTSRLFSSLEPTPDGPSATDLLERLWKLAEQLRERHPGFALERFANPDGSIQAVAKEIVLAASRYLDASERS